MGKRKAVVDAAARGVDEADGVDDLGLPPLAPVHATLGGTSSSDATVPVATDPSLYDAMAMEEVINADASEAVAEVVAEEEGTHVSSVTTADPPKRKVFKRERELNGVLRTYKIRMLPTPEQRQELKLAFSMARKAYNWAVDAVNNKRVPCNFQQLRNAFEKEPLPKWATGDSQCRQIGCGQGLNFYPNEKFGAKRQAKDWYGWEMGKTSTAYPPSDPKHWELKAKEQAAGQTPWHWNNQ